METDVTAPADAAERAAELAGRASALEARRAAAQESPPPAATLCGPWDVIVVGAGPAGALAARQLAAAGARVLLVDKASFPRAKACGCCLNGAALRTLVDCGLGDLVSRCGARRLHAVRLGAAGRAVEAALPDGAALSRERFDLELVRAAQRAGAQFSPRTRAIGSRLRADSREVVLNVDGSERACAARVVIAADGLAGSFLRDEADVAQRTRPRSRIGAFARCRRYPAAYQPGVIHMACGRGGYVGLVILEDGHANVAAAFDVSLVKQAGGLAQAAAITLGEAGFPPLDARDVPWRGTGELTRRRRDVAAERLFVLGDSAAYVEPFTGEGMSWALTGAAALAPIALSACRAWRPEHAQRWRAAHGRLFAWRQRRCGWVAAALRRPLLMRALVSPAWAMLSAPYIRALNAAPRAAT